MESHKLLNLEGTVVWRGSPNHTTNKFKKVSWFTVKCNSEYEGSILSDYFTIKTMSTNQIERIREGYVIRCQVRIKANPWRDENKQFKLKVQNDFVDGERQPVGQAPVIFYSLSLVGEIKIVSDSVDLENPDKNKKDEFPGADDLPF